jgi:hypothetical protein
VFLFFDLNILFWFFDLDVLLVRRNLDLDTVKVLG